MGFLELDADALAEVVGCSAPVQAEELDGAGVGGGEALANFDGGGFAGAVGAEQAEALAARDLEIDAVDGDDVGEGFAESAEKQGGRG